MNQFALAFCEVMIVMLWLAVILLSKWLKTASERISLLHARLDLMNEKSATDARIDLLKSYLSQRKP